jgi:hypothetical protein
VPFPHTVALPCLQIDNVAVICQRAQEHIHAGECILTYGYSKIVEQFLKAAGAKRKFQVALTAVCCVVETTNFSELLTCLESWFWGGVV